MLHAGLDLSRKRIDVCLIDSEGEVVGEFAVPADADAIRGLVRRVGPVRVRAVIESMSGARFVHDTLEQLGWEVLIADAQKVKGLAPLACKTDRIDARVLAVLSFRDLIPAIWLPDRRVRAEREQARFRTQLVRLKQRIHSVLINWGKPCPVTDLFGVEGRRLLDELEVPEPWRGSIDASLLLIDDLDAQIARISGELKLSGVGHRYTPLLMTAPGIGWVLGHTIGAEIGEIERFASPKKLVGYTGLCPRLPVRREGPSRRADQGGPEVPALGDARSHDARLPPPRLPRPLPSHQETPRRQRGAKVAQVDCARRLTEAISHMLTLQQPFAPHTPAAGGAAFRLAA